MRRIKTNDLPKMELFMQQFMECKNEEGISVPGNIINACSRKSTNVRCFGNLVKRENLRRKFCVLERGPRALCTHYTFSTQMRSSCYVFLPVTWCDVFLNVFFWLGNSSLDCVIAFEKCKFDEILELILRNNFCEILRIQTTKFNNFYASDFFHFIMNI